MDFIAKDKDFRPIAVIDLYSSAIWTERYSELGDFQLDVPLSAAYLDALADGNYLTLKDTDTVMIVESMNIESDISTGKKTATYKGRELASILTRRIVWSQKIITGNIEQVIRTLLNENAISPPQGQSARTIPNFTFPAISDEALRTYLRSINIEVQFVGDTLYDAIKSICDRFGLGFKIVFNNASPAVMNFVLYRGVDRSAEQTERDAIIFSPEYDTLINSRYLSDTTEYKNTAMILGEEEEGQPRSKTSVWTWETEPTGLDRRELFVDANDLRSQQDDGTVMEPSEYVASLQHRGFEKLDEKSISTVFDGQVETSIGPQYGVDYFLGDRVSTINEFGIGAVAQITEYIRGYDEGGYKEYPTFVMDNG